MPAVGILLRAAPLLMLASMGGAADPEVGDAVRRSVVRVFVIQRKPDVLQPWQSGDQESVTGSGCILPGGRVLTNAHVVADASFIQVRKADDSRKFDAKLEFIARDSELALLKIEDPAFSKEARPLALGPLPRARDKVAAYGFPLGGEDLSVTEGIVSRIEVTPYAFSNRDLLTLQIDAAISPGNSGGPVVKEGRLVGLSFQIYGEEGAQRANYAVPSPIIERFLKDIAAGAYRGVPDPGIFWEELENDGQREYYRLAPGQNGILVSQVVFGSPSWQVLKRGDVLSSINGIEIAGDGTYQYRAGQRLLFTHLFNMLQVGDRAKVGLIREGKPVSVELVMNYYRALVDDPAGNERPSYFVFDGFVFVPLTHGYLAQWNPGETPLQLAYTKELAVASEHRRQAVILSHVMAHPSNRGYHELRDLVVDSVNGLKIAELRDMVKAFARPEGKFHVILTDPTTDNGGRRIVLDARQAAAAQKEILSSYRIPADRSDDLK